MTMESSSIQVVTPGSQDDPFAAQPGSGTSGGQGTTDAEERGSQPNPQDASQQSEPGASAQDNTPAHSQEKGLSQAEVDALVQERIGKVQSGFDKRASLLEAQNRQLQEQLETQQRQAVERERQIQLEATPEHMRAQLKEQWNIEDERGRLEKTRTELLGYHKSVEALRIFQAYGTYGVTEEDLLECKTIEEMESLAKDKKISFFENGGKVLAPKSDSKAPEKKTDGAVPADIGNSPAGRQPEGLLTEQSIGAMGANIKSLFSQDINWRET